MSIDVSRYRNRHSQHNKLARLLWRVIWGLLFRPSPDWANGWRVLLIRLFGGHAGHHCCVRPSCRIWAPWNLYMGDYACLGADVDCYNVARVEIGGHATVSQYAFLCTASHDVTDPHMELVVAPIRIGAGAWVAARTFVSPGVTVGEGAVVGACSVVMKDVLPWMVVAGNPARKIKERTLREVSI